MSTLDKLKVDHDRLQTLLVILERELSAFDVSGEADLQLMQDVTTYYSEYFNRIHHPLEDQMFECLLRFGFSIEDGERAFMAHAELKSSTGVFLGYLDEVVNGGIVIRSDFIAAGRRFIESNLAHMEHEERVLFLWACDHLSDEDWQEVGRDVSPVEETVGYASLLQNELGRESQARH